MIKKICTGVIFLTVLAVAYYFISPFFINISIDEAAPVSNNVVANVLDEVFASTTQVTPTEIKPAPKVVEAQKIKFSSVIGTPGHKADGKVQIIETKSGDVVRYENFKTINGPDLFVYLAKDLDATEFVNLGELKATEGNVNYEIPSGVNVNEYRYVMVWCKQFSVLFNYADLSQMD